MESKPSSLLSPSPAIKEWSITGWAWSQETVSEQPTEAPPAP